MSHERETEFQKVRLGQTASMKQMLRESCDDFMEANRRITDGRFVGQGQALPIEGEHVLKYDIIVSLNPERPQFKGLNESTILEGDKKNGK